MRAQYTTHLEIGSRIQKFNGMEDTVPAAFVTINTDDIELHNRILSALTQVEDLEV